ncbi:putative RNA methyltransferase [Mycobacteroides abscessus subsp. massiliense]|uniref:class I SAM-dependent RNA methyltransferase n=1 Tax=Mycobacteroides abscessus TaxID=36809 RepID=UPI0009A64639|nr:TRAM domain-containing protein [Mycobacteroides abscessus]SKH55640.1 putative RNA methyltransferase [Mycobacteroides abscessus subsp. massiliense]SKH85969.1 putative RNA methyltransferase [Mycobacteroides abscessus subsp. massiliense]SKK31942.1 putative RNA methyltransferase [Mycobacteroides abscessus subsp. massiliense]SKK47812.1 putative RNA methyltransferase [Mycobacteroides abscessus subsp. massiliense]SKL88803.1 putative RNA methyltransferase [Mycobacteroides abscessus subsp. massilien
MTIGDILEVHTGGAANGGSVVARHDGRVIFVRDALPGERVRVQITDDRQASFWHGAAVEVLDPSPHRIEPLCPIAHSAVGSGCCDMSFADPVYVRELKGDVVSQQLARLGKYEWQGVAQPLGAGDPTGWRTRVRLDVNALGQHGFHRYHSDELVTDLRCAQVVPGLLDGLDQPELGSEGPLHAVMDDQGRRHVLRGSTIVEGEDVAVQKVGDRHWLVPVTAFWQAHRDAAGTYSRLVSDWAELEPGMSAWDLYGGVGVFAAALGEAVGRTGHVVSVDTSRPAFRSAKSALGDLRQVTMICGSVRHAIRDLGEADVAVLDPPRAGAGREVIGKVAAANVSRVIHIGCEAAAFARDVGLYLEHGYRVRELRVFDAFPLTHHIESFALLTR